jgi:uncharacterized protein with NRDE domain
MCLILFAHRVHPEFPLVFAANRDEFHVRPTEPARFWEDEPRVLAGRDLRAGGTWMGVTRSGRWAALTNVRDPGLPAPSGPSRGHLVGDFLRGRVGVADYAARVQERRHEYAGYNLLLGDEGEVYYLGNRTAPDEDVAVLAPGVYGLSNHLLDTPWPKVERGKRALRTALEAEGGPEPAALFEILAAADPAPDADLPDTGIGQAWERVLSSLFIVSPSYGTRASTVLLFDAAGNATFVERSFLPGPERAGEVRYRFAIASAVGS